MIYATQDSSRAKSQNPSNIGPSDSCACTENTAGILDAFVCPERSSRITQLFIVADLLVRARSVYIIQVKRTSLTRYTTRSFATSFKFRRGASYAENGSGRCRSAKTATR